MTLRQIELLVGKPCIHLGKPFIITGVHTYINSNGIQSVKLHLKGLNYYVKLEDITL